MALRTIDMSSSPGLKKPPLVLNASSIARLHTILAAFAFLAAFVVGCACHYKKIVQNGVAGYPEEWFPSVSATYVKQDAYPPSLTFSVVLEIGILRGTYFKFSLP